MNCGECGNVTAPGVGFPNHVYCKRFLLHMEKQEDASRCRYFIPTPITNADRIRAMTDEELASILAQGCHETRDCPTMLSALFPYDEAVESCEKCWLDWLRQEVEK